MLNQWKMDFESEDHRVRRDMTEKSIARSIKGETERQVTSSTTAASVFVSDCTCITGASVAQPTYLCCGLSNGSVCLLNTSNLSKIYLFEADRDARAALRDGNRRGGTPSSQLVAVATHPITPSGLRSATTAAHLLLCLTLDGVVCVCPMDMSAVLERKKVSRSDLAKVKPFPPMRSATTVYTFVQFNPKGNRIAAVVGLTQEDAASASAGSSPDIRVCVAVLSTADAAVTLQSQFTSEREWHTLTPPRAQPVADATPLELCCCGWWSADVLACVWSNSCLQLLDVRDMTLVGECRLLRHCAADAVTNATLSQPSSADTPDGVFTNIVALVLEHNVVATFYVTSRRTAGVDAPDLKRARVEMRLMLSVSPTLQTFCTEEIPVREMHLFRAFSWTLVLLLESGAVVFLDVEAMEMAVHRAVNRLRAPDAGRYLAPASLALPRRFFCVVNGKPFTAVVVEDNTAILLKSQ